MPTPAAPTAFAIAQEAILQFWNGAISNRTSIIFSFTNNAVATAQHVAEASTDAGVTWNKIGTTNIGDAQLSVGNLKNNTAYQFRLKAQDGGGDSAYTAALLHNTPTPATVAAPPIAPSTLAAGTVTSYSAVFTWLDQSNNEAYFWLEITQGSDVRTVLLPGNTTTVTPDLFALFNRVVAGLLITARVKAIGGTAHANNFPTASSTWSNSITVLMGPPTIRIISQLFVQAEKGAPFSYTILTNTTATAWTMDLNPGGAEQLPPGLSHSGAVLSGTPTATGVYNITITAGDGVTTDTRVLTLQVVSSLIVISSPDTATANLGEPFAYQITSNSSFVLGGSTTYSATSLPLWLTLDTALGTLTGIPDTAGTYVMQISASDSGHTGSQTLTITVPPVTITSAAVATAFLGQFFTFTLTAVPSGCVFTDDLGELPDWASLNGDNGQLLTGTPDALGLTLVDLTATETTSGGSFATSQTLALTVVPLFVGNDFEATVAVPVNQPFYFAGGATTVENWFLSYAPDGLAVTVDPYDATKRTVAITGSPTEAGVFDAILSVQVRFGGVPLIYQFPVMITVSGFLFIGWFHVDPLKQELQINTRTRELARYFVPGETPVLWLKRGDPCKLYFIWRDGDRIVDIAPDTLTLTIRGTDDFGSAPYLEIGGDAPASEEIEGHTVFFIQFDVTSDEIEEQFARLNASGGPQAAAEGITGMLDLKWTAGGVTYSTRTTEVTIAQDVDR